MIHLKIDELLYGNQIIEQLIMKWTSEDEEEYEEIQSLFSECDVEVASIDSLKDIETKSDPADRHDTLYELKK